MLLPSFIGAWLDPSARDPPDHSSCFSVAHLLASALGFSAVRIPRAALPEGWAQAPMVYPTPWLKPSENILKTDMSSMGMGATS